MTFSVLLFTYCQNFWLGNELCGSGIGARIDAEQYGKDVIALKNLVKELHPDLKTQPKVLGPGGFYEQKWFNTFLEVSGKETVDGITHHIYNLGPGNVYVHQLNGHLLITYMAYFLI